MKTFLLSHLGGGRGKEWECGEESYGHLVVRGQGYS